MKRMGWSGTKRRKRSRDTWGSVREKAREAEVKGIWKVENKAKQNNNNKRNIER